MSPSGNRGQGQAILEPGAVQVLQLTKSMRRERPQPMAIELSTEQLERQIAAFERRMHEAGEDEDYDEAARLKHRIEPLKVELGQRKVAEQQAAEKNIERAVMKAEARKADVEADMIVAHFEKPSSHDKQMLSSIGVMVAAKHDKELIATATKPSAHDRHMMTTHAKPSSHDREALKEVAIVDPSAQDKSTLSGVGKMRPTEHDRELIKTSSKPTPHDKHMMTTHAKPSSHDREALKEVAIVDPSSHDKEALSGVGKMQPSAHDRHQLNPPITASTHDKELIATHATASSHDKETLSSVGKMAPSSHDKALISTHSQPSAKDKHVLHPPKSASAVDREQLDGLGIRDKSAQDKEAVHVMAGPTAHDRHLLNPPRLPKPKAPPPAVETWTASMIEKAEDVENAKSAAEATQEQLVSEALGKLHAQTPRQPLKAPPAHPCKCTDLQTSSRARCIFAIILQGVVLPIVLIVLAISAASVPATNDAETVNDVGSWWPYLLTLPAFLDVVLVAMVIYRERGPGGSLEYQLFPCFPSGQLPGLPSP